MTKYFFIGGLIDKPLYESFLSFASANEDYEWEISISSTGGHGRYALHMISIINERVKKTTLVCIGAYSAAFLLFFQADCKKKLVMGCFGMWHYGRHNDIAIDDRGKILWYEDNLIIKQSKNLEGPWSKTIARSILTKKEMRQFSKGRDVFLPFHRMKEIFPDAKTI